MRLQNDMVQALFILPPWLVRLRAANRIQRLVYMVALALLAPSNAFPAPGLPRLLGNAGFEQATPDGGLPEGWKPVSIGVEAAFALDDRVKHGGTLSARITCAEITRSYFRSTAIPVAPGERISVSAWVNTKDVPAKKGAVIVIADFFVRNEATVGGPAKVAVGTKAASWERIQGSITVPPRANLVRLRCGFSYSSGTCWWDDFEVRSIQPLVARAVLPDGRLRPQNGKVAVEILNRDQRQATVKMRYGLDKRTFEQPVALTGEAWQRIEVPISLPAAGKHDVNVELADHSGQKLFASGDMPTVVPPPLAMPPLIPTHWVIEDGAPQIEGEVELGLPGTSAQLALLIQLLAANGRVCAEEKLSLAKVSDASENGIYRFRLSPPGLTEGNYRVVATITGSDGKARAVEQPWHVIHRSQARVTLNEHGFPVADGRAIFPLGMFNNTAKVEESAAAGINLVHMYNAARVQAGSRPDDQRPLNGLDQAERAGMHGLLLVPMEFAFAGEWEAFSRRIRMFRNHPALLAWCEEEGLARGDMKIEVLQRMRQILQTVDPHHPFMVGDAHTVINRVTDRSKLFPVAQMDMGMWWWYPFPLKATQGDALEGTEAGGLALEAPAFLVQRASQKPVWVGIQSYRKPGVDGRYPTPVEYRAQAFLAIISGAQGLMWYGGSVTGGLFLDAKAGHWTELKALAEELKGLTPLLLQPAEATPVLEPSDAQVSAAVRCQGGRAVLIAVNRGPKEATVKIKVAGLEASAVNVPREQRAVPVADGTIQEQFAPYATHVYEWRK